MKYCTQPSCRVFVKKGYCRLHARQLDRQRGTSAERGYDATWSALSRRFRQAWPVCGMRADGTLDAVNSRCVRDGLTTPADCVDHTIPISQGGGKYDEQNLMSACQRCNVLKRNTLDAQRERRR